MRHLPRLLVPLLALALLQINCRKPASQAAGPAPAPTVSEQELQKMRQVLEQDMGDQPANLHYNMGNVYVAAGKYQEAINEYKQALQLDPKDADSYVHMGDAYLALKAAGRL